MDFKYLNWPKANQLAKIGSTANNSTLRQPRTNSVNSRVKGLNLRPAS